MLLHPKPQFPRLKLQKACRRLLLRRWLQNVGLQRLKLQSPQALKVQRRSRGWNIWMYRKTKTCLMLATWMAWKPYRLHQLRFLILSLKLTFGCMWEKQHVDFHDQYPGFLKKSNIWYRHHASPNRRGLWSDFVELQRTSNAGMKRPNISFVQTIDNKCHRSFHRVFDASGNLRSLRTIISHKKLPMPGNRQLVQTAGTKRMQSSRRFWKLGNPGAGPWAIPFEAMWFNHGSYMVHINHTRYTEKMIKMRLKIDVSKSRVDRTRDSKRYGPILIYLCIRSLGSRRVRLHCSTYFFNAQWLNLALRLAHKGANACLKRP